MADIILPPPLSPMLAKAGKMPVNGEAYGFEIKWDGIRALVYISGGNTAAQSRNGKDISGQYPELAPLGKILTGSDLILDGELVALAENGHPSFSALQHRMGLRTAGDVRRMAEKIPVTYIIFDVLYMNGGSTCSLPYNKRRRLLEDLCLDGQSWRTPPTYPGNGPELLAASCNLGLEGIIAKRLDSRYEAGKRSGAWIKIKNQRRQELIIAGWVEGEGRRGGRVGAVLTGYYDITAIEASAAGRPQRLLYAGKVGTGFSEELLDKLREAFKTLQRPDCPFWQKPPVKNVSYLEPCLVGEFEFTEWTAGGTLRHPSFKGLRNDKEPTAVIRE